MFSRARSRSDVYRDISRSNKEFSAAARQRFWLYLIYKYSLALRSLVSMLFLPHFSPFQCLCLICLTPAHLPQYDIWSQSVKQSVFDATVFYIISGVASMMICILLTIRALIGSMHEQLQRHPLSPALRLRRFRCFCHLHKRALLTVVT